MRKSKRSGGRVEKKSDRRFMFGVIVLRRRAICSGSACSAGALERRGLASAIAVKAEQTYYAHSAGADGKPELLSDHLAKVSRLAGEFAAAFGASEWGAAVGRWHDLGKYSREFQEYLKAT